MAENKSFATCASATNTFKEAVCIDAGRIYDSCSELQQASYRLSSQLLQNLHKRPPHAEIPKLFPSLKAIL